MHSCYCHYLKGQQDLRGRPLSHVVSLNRSREVSCLKDLLIFHSDNDLDRVMLEIRALSSVAMELPLHCPMIISPSTEVTHILYDWGFLYTLPRYD